MRTVAMEWRSRINIILVGSSMFEKLGYNEDTSECIPVSDNVNQRRYEATPFLV